MKVLYLFSSYRSEVYERVRRGEDHGNGFWGMFKLPQYGIDATYAEPEQFYPKTISQFIRRHLSVYWLHLSVFFTFFSYDFIFTSTAFGTQLIHTLLHIRRPRWIMHDFSITGLMGEEKTLRQKVFACMVGRCAGIVTLGIEEKEKLEKRFPHLKGKVEFVPFGVDLAFFKPTPIKEERKIFAVGFDPDRDWKTFFESVEGLSVPVTVATRSSRVEGLFVPENVTINQFTPIALAQEYRDSMMVIIPVDTSQGINDAMGCSTLFEAMASGKPVIASRTHTMASYITHGENGILVPERNPEALRSAIKKLVSDPALRIRLGRNARTYAEKYLDANEMGERLAVFFKRL